MILKILEIMDKGDMTKQRLVFEVINNGNLIDYKIVNDTFPERESFSKLDRYFYSFPDFEVKQGQYVVLYFKDGKQHTEKFVDGICHFFYYGVDYANWGDDEVTYLLHLSNQKKILKTINQIELIKLLFCH